MPLRESILFERSGGLDITFDSQPLHARARRAFLRRQRKAMALAVGGATLGAAALAQTAPVDLPEITVTAPSPIQRAAPSPANGADPLRLTLRVADQCRRRTLLSRLRPLARARQSPARLRPARCRAGGDADLRLQSSHG